MDKVNRFAAVTAASADWPGLFSPTLGKAAFLALLFAIQMTTHVSYLLFHSLVELFSVVVAFSLFTITWNSRQFIKNQYLLFIGIGYLFIGSIDLLHTLSYKGMQIFTDYDYYANQLWIGARYMESITLLAAFSFLNRERSVPVVPVFVGYAAVTILLTLSVFAWKIFPVCFIEGQGLTPFKKTSEYIICLILATALLMLSASKEKFAPTTYRMIFWSIVFTIISELAFTFYISNYGFSNLVGHYFKLFSFTLVYKAILINGMIDPYILIFREMNDTNLKLEKALAEVKTLSGLLPICSSCKRIRNEDDNSWQQIEDYIATHSDADFTHGICPECAQRLYPELYHKKG